MVARAPIKPLTKSHRKYTFLLLLAIFICAIPLLYLYATGYRFDLWGDKNFVASGGIFISAERSGAEIYIDQELVRETRVFRRAFYAQNLDPGTHRVHVQREGAHTWVKELPVYAHLVTEAESFNLSLIPSARLVTKWQTSAGGPIVFAPYVLRASSTQNVLIATTSSVSAYVQSTEYTSRLSAFQLPKATTTKGTTEASYSGTSTKDSNGVRLFFEQGEVFATWTNGREEMPYYFCAEPFPLLEGATSSSMLPDTSGQGAVVSLSDPQEELQGAQVQTVAPEQECEPQVRMDRKGEKVRAFDFFPGSTDLVLLLLDSGVYVVEIDDRGWQNTQPVMVGKGLDMRVIDGRIYVFDKTVIYEMLFD